ncbi:MAG: family 43 glycosylhydrolase, partial [Muribaculaceae bacterium]|nr:family 43 glycosylhydrolase [Muribaculaceae bacterium]
MKHLIGSAIALAALASPMAASAESPVDKDLAGYLFTYFTGNNINQEQIHFGLSVDGHHFYALNDNLPVISSSEISSTGGVRDPHILRRQDGQGFYMVVTDMVSDNGWDSNRAMVLMKSPDLVNWESSVVNIQKRYPNQTKLKRVWAPQTIFDRESGKYIVYWSMQHGDGPDIIYYAYANDDFTDLEGDYKPLFIPADGKSCIDGDIVYHDGKYHLFYKT